MNLKIKTYQGQETTLAADIALKNRLYVSGWCLSGEFRRIRMSPINGDLISIAFEDDIAIGVCLKRYNRLDTFVRKSKRRKGIGKALVKSISDNKSYGVQGLRNGQSEDFYVNCNVRFRW